MLLEIICDMCLWSGDGFPDVLVVNHDPKFTSMVFWVLVKSLGSCLIVGFESAYRKNTNAKVERANSVISDTLLPAPTDTRTTGTGSCPSRCCAVNIAASTLGDRLMPFFIDCSAHPSLQLTDPVASSPDGELQALYARRMCELELTVRELLAAVQKERKAKLDTGQVDTVFKVGTSCCCGQRSCLSLLTSVSCCCNGTDPSPSLPARDPTPIH
jgi:hypothetical protein